MKIAVITPYYKEDDAILDQCHQSVRGQTMACDHFLVADGFPKPIVDRWQARHMILPQPHADIGNMPRILGSLSAFNLGYDAVAFLDADNWYHPDHIERLVQLHTATGAVVCTSSRSMHRPDGSYMFDDDKNDGKRHVDSNCFFLTRPAIKILTRWAAMPRQLSPITDTVYWETIKRARLSHAHNKTPTVCYRTTWESDFKRMAEPMPEGVKRLEMTDAPYRWIKALSAAERRRIRSELGWPLGLPAKLARRLIRMKQNMLFSRG